MRAEVVFEVADTARGGRYRQVDTWEVAPVGMAWIADWLNARGREGYPRARVRVWIGHRSRYAVFGGVL